MEVLLLKPQREGQPGDIVTVEPMRAAFLIEVGAAVRTGRRKAETPEKKTAKRETRAAKAEPEETKKAARAARKKA